MNNPARSGRAGFNDDPLGDHERGIEADAELTDDIDVAGAFLQLLLELQRSAVSDRAEVGFSSS